MEHGSAGGCGLTLQMQVSWENEVPNKGDDGRRAWVRIRVEVIFRVTAGMRGRVVVQDRGEGCM